MRGSHAKLERKRHAAGDRHIREVLVVPMHRAPRIGTVRVIYRQASRFIPKTNSSRASSVDRGGMTVGCHQVSHTLEPRLLDVPRNGTICGKNRPCQ